MWGCLRMLLFGIGAVFLLLILVVSSGYWYLGTSSFADLIRLRIEKTLEARLGRDVTIGKLEVVRSRPQKVILTNLTIANAPGALHPHFATIGRVEIEGGVDSFWGRRVKVDHVDLVDPIFRFEVFPEGAALVHNFPKWQPAKRSRYEIYRLEIGTLHVKNGTFDFNDRRHKVTALTRGITSQVQITLAKGVYEGTMSSPATRLTLQDYQPIDLTLNGAFRYTPGALALKSVALKGDRIQTYISGKLDPLTEAAYDLKLTAQLSLDKIQEIFRVEKTLGGPLSIDGRIKGKQGDFSLTGGWISNHIVADTYELTRAKGTLNITDERALIDVESANYGGGTIGAHYELTRYAEPYPMSVDLRYNRISIEQLFNDWTVENTGLRGAATGDLTYRWNKDRLLDGSGEGSAQLSRNTVAFSRARYPIPLAGSADFALDKGVVRFRRAELDTDASHISLTGTLRIEDVVTDLTLAIQSRDFAELDRAAYNFAHSAGKKDFELLGLGGAGEIRGTVRGAIKAPDVVAQINSTGTKYNEVLLGAADIALRYDGGKSTLTFDRAVFREGDGRLELTGTVAFPDRGPSPRFDIAIDATNYPVDRAMQAVELKFAARGLGTGRLVVTGTPDSGKVNFAGLTILQNGSELRLKGTIAWLPGEGNVNFDLDIGARAFPVADVVAFLDLGELPVTGELTGTLHIEGPKKALEGAGGVTVRAGSIFGEPVDLASADIVFTAGKLQARNVTVQAPAGEIKGEAEFDLTTEKFSYTIQSSSIDLSRLKLLAALKGLLGGNIILTSSGGGTFDQPELVVEAVLNDATLRGLTLPPGSAPPRLYIAIRGGRLVVRGAIAEIVSIEGDGTVGEEMAIDGNVRITITDIARLATISPNTASFPAAGNAIIDLRLGGRLSPIEALRVDGSIPEFNLTLSGVALTPVQPLRFSMRDGRIQFDSFEVRHADSTFSVTGSLAVTGNQQMALALKGRIDAALLQLVVPDLRAGGPIALDIAAGGTLTAPRLTGQAELDKANFRFAGFPQTIDDVTGVLKFEGDAILIESIRATLGGGTVIAGGRIDVDGLMPKRLRVTLSGDDVSIRYFAGVTVEGDFELLLSGDAERAVLQGDVHVDRAQYFKDFDFQESLLNVILSRRGVTPIVAASWQDRVSLNLRVTAPETLAVRNNIADVTGSAELEVAGTLGNPVLLGLVTLDEGGRVRFQNIDYRVVRGTINFQNPFRIDPYFDVTVEGRISGGSFELEDSGPVEVTVNLTGTLDRFTPTITSDPPASDITLFSLLGFGALGGGSGQPVDPTKTGQNLIFSSVINAIGSRYFTFVDAFAFDPGSLESGSDPGAKVSFERRLSSSVRLLVVYSLRDSHSRQVLEWQVTPDWTAQGMRDTIRTKEYRAEARFRRRYAGQWSWGDRGKNPLTMLASLEPDDELPRLPPMPASTRVVPPEKTRPVTKIEFRSDAPFDSTPLLEHLDLKVGEPVSVRGAQSTLKNLYSLGDFRDVRIESVDDGAGVAVTIALYLHYRVGRISFKGVDGGDRARAERKLTVRTGNVLSLDAVDDSGVAIQEELQKFGFLEVTVDPETTFSRPRSRADVTFHVTTGPLTRIADVTFEGDIAPFTKQELIKRMRREPGETFRAPDARNDGERIRNFLLGKEYRRAEVRYLGHTYDPATKGVTVRYRVAVGPKVRVEVEGVNRRAVRRLLPFDRNQSYSEDVIDRAAEEIVAHYQRRGHFNAAVDTEGRMLNGEWVTTFHIKPGAQFKLTEVTFTGRAKLPDKELRRVIATSSRGGFMSILTRLLRRPSGPTREQLDDDKDALESYYRLQGFSEAAVGTPVVATRADGTMTVDFPITEGPQTLLTAVKIEGNEQVPTDDLPQPALEIGKPLNPQIVREDLVRLQTFYADRGNAEMQITPRVDVTPDKTGAVLTYVIAEGPKTKIDEVVVRGNTYTDTNVVERKSDLDTGDAFSYTSILEAQRNLYRLGIFRRVDIQPEQAGTTAADRNVVISVEEGKNLTVSGSLGFTKQSDTPLSLLGSAAISHRNLFGTGRFLGLEVVKSRDQRNEAFLTYREPFFFKWNVPVQLTVFQSDTRRPRAHLVQRGTFIEATKVARFQTRWSARYEYKIGECVEEGDPTEDLCAAAKTAILPGIDREVTNIRISSVSPTFFWDRRDDTINPHRGFFTSASIEYAFKLFEADAHFLKEFAQATYYLPLTERTTGVISARVGMIQPQGGTVVPLSERFTAGGESSHRAFLLDRLGYICEDPTETECEETLVRLPDGTIAPLGGNGLFVLNAEYRFPVFSSVGGALFLDAGNVYKESTIRFRDLRYGIGTGVRYLSPVGPLRFDIGYKLNRRAGEDPFAYFVTFGYAF